MLKCIVLLLLYVHAVSAFVAVCVCVRSSAVDSVTNIRYTPLMNILVPSFRHTTVKKDDARLYVAIDSDDFYYNRYLKVIQSVATVVIVNKTALNGRIPFNEITQRAQDDGAEYIVRVNDDTEFVTNNWVQIGKDALRKMDPPNVEIVVKTIKPDQTIFFKKIDNAVRNRVLVTGGAGFIGMHTSIKLKQKGNFVVAYDIMNAYYNIELKKARKNIILKENITFIEADVCDSTVLSKTLQTYAINKIVHLAAQAGVRYSLSNPSAYTHNNIDCFLTLLETIKTQNIHLVYASSSSVYGLNTKIPFAETDPVENATSMYATTKRSTELMARTYFNLYGLKSIGLRFFTVYGPWGRPDMAYWSFIENIIDKKPIHMFNHGNLERDFTYIDDIVNGIVRSLSITIKQPEIINLGNNNPVKLTRFIDVIERSLNKKAIIESVNMQAGDVPKTYADLKKAYNLLGYVPLTTINDGIPQFIEWYKKWKNGLYHQKKKVTVTPFYNKAYKSAFTTQTHNELHVVYSGDNDVTFAIETSIRSILRHASEPVIFHYIGTKRLEAFPDVDFIDLHHVALKHNLSRFVNLKLRKGLGNLNSVANYVRFVLDDIFPQLTKIMWIDADTIIKCDISSLIHAAFSTSNYVIAAVERLQRPSGLVPTFETMIRTSFNAGVIIINLFEWREQKIIQKIVKWSLQNQRKTIYHFGSQPPLALSVGEQFEHLDSKWNVDGLGYNPSISSSKLQNACLLHWTGPRKYWHSDGLYKEYANHYITQPTNIASDLDISDKPKGVIITSFFTGKKDPQRGVQYRPTMAYMSNLYTSVDFLRQRLIILHDRLSDKDVNRFKTDRITFIKVATPSTFSTNDYRFIQYEPIVKELDAEYVLFVDASDVYLWNDPFIYMEKRPNFSMFLSNDIGTILTNDYIQQAFKHCYNETYKTIFNSPEAISSARNAGLWGGRKSTSLCILKCIVDQLTTIAKRGNCNMPVYNWCIKFSACVTPEKIDNTQNSLWTNPFRKNCDMQYSVVHNKCIGTEARRCLYIKNKTLQVEKGKNMQMCTEPRHVT